MQIDVATAGIAATLAATIASGIVGFLKVFRKYDGLPDRVTKIEAEQKRIEQRIDNCKVKDMDVSKLQESIDALAKKSESDYRMIKQINRSQQIMMDGLCAIIDHQATGNHTEKMEEVKTAMMKELVRSREEVLDYE